MEYQFSDYIEDYSKFLKIINKKINNMRLLITGACGHIGSYLIENVHKIKKLKSIFN